MKKHIMKWPCSGEIGVVLELADDAWYTAFMPIAFCSLQIVKMLREADKVGLPPDEGCAELVFLTEDEWNAVLDKIIAALEICAVDEISRENMPIVEDGLDLFRAYFLSLWD